MFWTVKLLLVQFKKNIKLTFHLYHLKIFRMLSFLLVEIVCDHKTVTSYCMLLWKTKRSERKWSVALFLPLPLKPRELSFHQIFFFFILEGWLKSWSKKKLKFLMTGDLISLLQHLGSHIFHRGQVLWEYLKCF